MDVFLSAVVFGIIMPPIVGFVLGMRHGWKWIWLGVVTAGLIEAMQIHVEGSPGKWATGQDWSNWLMTVAVFCAISFYGSFAFGAAWSLLRLGGRAGREGVEQ